MRQKRNFRDFRTLWQGFNGEGRDRVPVWYTYGKAPTFRHERYADECWLRSIRHKGWYQDDDCMLGVIRGRVAYIGRGLWIAGYEDTEHGQTVWYPETYASDDEPHSVYDFLECEAMQAAARAADHYAERAAEAERDYNRHWSEAQTLADDIAEHKAKLPRLLGMRNDPRPCYAAVRDEVRELIETIRDLRAKLADDYSDVETC